VPNVPWAQKSFWLHSMDLLGDVGQMELVLVHLEIMLISTQVRFTVCAEHAIGSKIILGTPDGTPR
jgi:hypothetical protein